MTIAIALLSVAVIFLGGMLELLKLDRDHWRDMSEMHQRHWVQAEQDVKYLRIVIDHLRPNPLLKTWTDPSRGRDRQ